MRAARLLSLATLVVFASQGSRLHAAEPGWRHLSSKKGDLPVPGKSTQQTACLIADLDRSGRNGFVLGFRVTGPALVWYRPSNKSWDRQVIEPEFLTIEAGGAVHDIDGDGWPDVVFGGDWQSSCLWWWRNPGKNWMSDVPWERHTIKKSGKTQHHDQCIADFKGIGTPQLAYWNQGASTLFVAEMPSHPRQLDEWPAERVFSGYAGESPGKYAEGMSSCDIDGDGRPEILAGNHMFLYDKSGQWRATRIGDFGGLIFAGRFIKDARFPQVVIAPGDGSGPVKWYECNGNPLESKNWMGHDLVGRTMIHPHSLQVADIDGDGNLDIFVAEMAKWTESKQEPDNPKAQAFIFYGDGKGNFRKTIFQTGMGFHEARVADLNGDGKLDILSKPYNWETPRLDIWLNQGPAQSSAKVEPSSASSSWQLMLLDPIPGDGGRPAVPRWATSTATTNRRSS
jgi:FG-GAP-like repeat